MNLTKLSWPKGYVPSEDAINGDPSALLRADNLQQEENGSLGLVRGYKNILNFGDAPTDIHSKSSQGLDYIYVGSARAVQEVDIYGNQRFPGDIVSGGGTKPAISDVYGFVLATSGTQRKKFDGGTIYNLGLPTPTVPLKGFVIQAQTIETTPGVLGGEWVLDAGIDLTLNPAEGPDGTPINAGTSGDPNEVIFTLDPTTLSGIIECDFGSPADLVNIGGQQSSTPATDTFTMEVQMDDSNSFTSIRVIFLLDKAGNNYYWYEWDIATNSEFNYGIGQWSSISTQRANFIRQGNDSTLDWTTVLGIVIQVQGVSSDWIGVSVPRWTGGVKGQLYGFYQYIYRYTMDMGSYVAKGAWSPPSEIFACLNGSIAVLPPTPPGVSGTPTTGYQEGIHYYGIEIARISVVAPNAIWNGQTGLSVTLPDLLDQYYWVGQLEFGNVGGYFLDSLGDTAVLEIDNPANLFLLSVQDISESITDIIPSYNGRTLYITTTQVYFSDQLNPDSVDVRYTLKPSGTPIDINLWCRKISNGMLILGSTADLYEITGTLASLPDGSIDVQILSIGEAYPPISYDVTAVGGYLFYVAADGIRMSGGSNTILISDALSLLFDGIARHGIPAVNIVSGAVLRYPITNGLNKLFVSLPHKDGVYRLHVYDLLKKTWTLRQQSVTALGSTQSDNVVMGLGSQLVWTDYGQTYTNSTPLPINLLTVYDNNGQPRNRKDTSTLKLVIDTGGDPVSLYLGKDGQPLIFITNVNSNGVSTVYVDLASHNLGFRYAMQLIGPALYTFKLYEYTIEYDPRPEQNVYLRIPNSNLGSTGRKRFISYPLVLDCLESTVRFRPIIDNVLQADYTDFTSLDQKETHSHFFISDTVGTDIGGILESLDGGPFELTGPDFGKAISEMMPAPAEYLYIQPNNFGAPNRKRSTSIKFELNTRGSNVRFAPILDGVTYGYSTFNSGGDIIKTMEYFFDPGLFDPTFIDLGGALTTQGGPFEFYGQLIPQQMEQFPARLESLFIPENNFGSATRKRIRTLPLVINTNGENVTFTPYVDGAPDTPAIFNTPRKKTVYYFFNDDSFGIDYAGWLAGASPFEFYSLETPVNVELLPAPKKYDQIGPLRFDKIGKLLAIRVRLILVGTTTVMPIQILGQDQETVPTYDNTLLFSGSFAIQPGKDRVYHINMPKSINGSVMRVVLGPTTDAFHRFDIQARVQLSGMETDARWIPMK